MLGIINHVLTCIRCDHHNLCNVVLGVISVISPTSLDREMQSSLMLRLIASDGGANALASSLFITVELEDINDNPPVFTETVYTATVREVSMYTCNIIHRNCARTEMCGIPIVNLYYKRMLELF